MTPAERQLVAELFDRLATLEDAPRDPDAERVIRDGLQQAPNAVYALVQTALVQDEALKRANERILELEAQLNEGSEPPRQGGFLDNMRDNLFGRRDEQRGSVPRVRPADAPMGVPPGFGAGQAGAGGSGGPGYGAAPAPMPPEPQGRGGSFGGSFLGTAAAAAAGAIGGSLLLDGIRSMAGHKGTFGLADQAGAGGRDGGSPWGGGGSSGGGSGDDLSRQAGLDDVGRSGSAPLGQSQGLTSEASHRDDDPHSYDDANDDQDIDAEDFDDGDFDDDFGNDEESI
jgi:hypothetical protein